MKSVSLLLSLLVWSQLGSADVLNLTLGKENKNGIIISTGATATVNGQTVTLTTVGSGLRQKKVVIVPVNVYVAQVLVSDAARYVKTNDGALPSLDANQTVAMHLSFLRNVDASTINEAFQASLDVNGISQKDPDIIKFKQLVDELGGLRDNGSLTILLSKNTDGTETLVLENKKDRSESRSHIGAPGLTHKLMSMWLGVPADSYLEALKAELLQ